MLRKRRVDYIAARAGCQRVLAKRCLARLRPPAPANLVPMRLPLLLLLLFLPFQAFAAPVLRVVDGDTLVVLLDGKREKVRLLGLDAPESVHPQKPVERFGKEASAFTRKMLFGKDVTLEYAGRKRDRYGRLLAYVWLEGRLVNLEIIRAGYGFAPLKYPHPRMEEFRRAEREAREKGRGLWGR